MLAIPLGLTLIPSLSAAGQCFYEAIVIQAPPCAFVGSPPTAVSAINDVGEVVGWFPGCGDPPYRESFIWSEAEGMQLLERQAGLQSILAHDLNNQGIVVGYGMADESSYPRGFVYSDSVMTLLEPLYLAGSSWASSVNDAGTVVGTRSVAPSTYTGFIWTTDEGFVDLGLVSGSSTGARAINQAGVIVGGLGGYPLGEAFLYDEDGLHPLGIPAGANGSHLREINDARQAAGTVIWTKQGFSVNSQAALWQDGTWLLLDSPDGCQRAYGSALNDVGTVVGYCYAPDPHTPDDTALIWMDGEGFDLNDLVVSPEVLHIYEAVDINASGEILAYAADSDSDVVGLLLRALDRPESDITGDCRVGVPDLQWLISNWGQADSPADVNDDGSVGFADLVEVLIDWTT